MGAQKENGLALQVQGLAERLEALTEKLGSLERENAELRNEMVAPRGSDTPRNGAAETSSLVPRQDGGRASGFEGQVSRRALLGKAGAAAVAAMAAGTLLFPREARADTFDNVQSNSYVLAVTSVTGLEGVRGFTADLAKAAVIGEHRDSGVGVEGIAKGASGTGVKATGRYGVWGESNQAGFYGVTGRNTLTDGTGVRGVTNNTDGSAGVRGEGATGVWGSSPKTDYSGVYGQHTGSSGYGVVGDGKGLGYAGVLGRNPAGTGMRGEGVVHGVHGKTTSGGTGVYGEGGNGYAGAFSGGKAQLRIVPKPGTGRPTGGSFGKGDVYMDSAANLFVCVAGGSPGTWKKISTVAVS